VLILLQGFGEKFNPGTEGTADDNGLAHFYDIF
jgi:hypothetical protein